MINPNEVINVLHLNGFDTTSPSGKVREILKLLGYHEIDIESLLSMLKSNGWFPTENIEGIPPASIPSGVIPVPIMSPSMTMETSKPNSTPSPQTSELVDGITPLVPPTVVSDIAPNNSEASAPYLPRQQEVPQSSSIFVYMAVTLLVLVLGAGTAYAYMERVGPFAETVNIENK